MRLLLFLCLTVCASVDPASERDIFAVDPDVERDVPLLITTKGYQFEQYEVITEDGYKLTVHRIPCRRNETGTPQCNASRPVAFLQHGLLCSSSNWVTNLANESLGLSQRSEFTSAYLLADAGYDVFLGNVRGNQYSLGHVSLDPSQAAFWQFSLLWNTTSSQLDMPVTACRSLKDKPMMLLFDEFAKFDLPAMIDTALNVSGQQQLYYIGHSQGTMIGFIQFSDPVLASKIKHFYALGPVATVKHIKGALAVIAPFTRTLSWAFWALGVKDFLPHGWLFNLLAETVCTIHWTDKLLCGNILFLIAGYDSVQLNMTRVPVYVGHSPSGTSAQDIIHFGQLVESGKFCKFDYGKAENQKKYHQDTPPEYDVTKMKVPVTLYWGEEDWLADPQDIKEYLLPKLQNVQGDFKLKETNHLDLIWGMRVVNDCYKPMIADMNKRNLPKLIPSQPLM